MKWRKLVVPFLILVFISFVMSVAMAVVPDTETAREVRAWMRSVGR